MLICKKCQKILSKKSALIAHEKFCKGLLYCKKCGKLLEKQQKKYCSHKCSAFATNKGRIHSEETRKKISLSQGGSGKIRKKEKFCLHCKNPLTKSQLKFCNNFCRHEFENKNIIKKWLVGEIDGNSKAGHATYVKKYLLKKYENKCSKCGWGEINTYLNSLPLEVEHIDGDCHNNDPSNVDLLCPNCHSLTKTYRGANRGNGRRSYLKKYYIK